MDQEMIIFRHSFLGLGFITDKVHLGDEQLDFRKLENGFSFLGIAWKKQEGGYISAGGEAYESEYVEKLRPEMFWYDLIKGEYNPLTDCLGGLELNRRPHQVGKYLAVVRGGWVIGLISEDETCWSSVKMETITQTQSGKT